MTSHRKVSKQVVVNGELVTFVETARYKESENLEDYIFFRSILKYAEGAYGVLPEWEKDAMMLSRVFNRIMSEGVVTIDDVRLIVRNKNKFRYVRKSAVEKVLNWLKSAPVFSSSVPGIIYPDTTQIVERSDDPVCITKASVDADVERICSKVEEPKVDVRQELKATPLSDQERINAMERMRSLIDESFHKAMERHFTPYIRAMESDFSSHYAVLGRSLEYQRSVGIELREQITALKQLNQSLKNENEQLRKRNDKLIRDDLLAKSAVVPATQKVSVQTVTSTAPAQAPAPSFMQRWFGMKSAA